MKLPSNPYSCITVAGATRPPHEWWEADDQNLGDSPNLLSTFEPSAEGTEVEYHWRPKENVSNLEAATKTLPAAAKGAAAGFFTVGGLVMVTNVLHAFSQLGHVDIPLRVGTWLVSGLAGAGAGSALSFALKFGENKKALQEGTVIPGVIRRFGEEPDAPLKFYANGKVLNEVDLGQFAAAPVGPVPDQPDQWWLRSDSKSKSEACKD